MLKQGTIMNFVNMQKFIKQADYFHFNNLITSLESENTWLKGDMNYHVLHQSPSENILLVIMHENNEFESFQANNSLVILVLHGKLNFKATGYNQVLEAGMSLSLSEKEFYLLEALEKSSFLLTGNNA